MSTRSSLTRVIPIAAFALTACVKTPPVLHPTSVPAPTVPPLAATPTAETYGWVRAHEIVRTLQRLGADSAIQSVQRNGIDPAQVDPAKPIVIVAGDPSGGLATVPLAAWLPVAPESQVATMARAMAGPDNALVVDGGFAVSLHRPPVAADQDTTSLVLKLVHAPLLEDLELVIHSQAFAIRFANEIKRFFDEMEHKMLNPTGTARPVDPAFVQAYIDWLRGWVDGMHSLAIGVGVSPDVIDLYSVSRDKSHMKDALPATAESMPNLAQFVEPGDFRMMAAGREFGRFTDLIMRFYEPLKQSRPDLYTRMRQVMGVLMNGSRHTAFGFGLSSDRLFHGTAVSVGSDAAKQASALREIVELMRDPELKKLLGKNGVEMKIDLQRGSRKVRGWAVDRMVQGINVDTSHLKSVDRELLSRLLERSWEVEFCRVGDYLVYAVNEPPATLDRIVGELLEGKGSAPPMVARSSQPDGGRLYMDFNAAKFLKDVKAVMPEKYQRDWPSLDESIPPITFFGYGPEGTGYYRTQVPLRLVNAVRDLAKKKN